MTPKFDPLDEAQLADPFPTYRALRSHEPAQRVEVGGGTWVVSRYDDVKPLVRDVEGLMRPPGSESPPEFAGGPAERIHRGLMVLNDAPVHTRLPKLTEKAMTRGAVERLRTVRERRVGNRGLPSGLPELHRLPGRADRVTYRHFTHDVEVARVTIPAGEPIWLLLLSANHDEARFADPDAIDVTRSPNNHIAFGGAQHFCVGNQLARLEGEVVFREIGRRVGSIELTGEAPRRPNFQFRSFLTLPVKVAAR